MTDDTTPDTPALPEPEAFAPLPGDTPMLQVLATLARQIRAKTGKPPSFMAIPRKLALTVAGERAAEKQTMLEDAFMRACLNGRLPAVLLALPVEPDGPAVPIVALEMPVPLAAAWHWPVPRFAVNEGFEEHPVYAACPFSRELWDKGEGMRIPQLTKKVLDWCVSRIQTQAAPVHQPVIGQERQARPLMAPEMQAEMLPEEIDAAQQAVSICMDERQVEIRKALNVAGMYGIEFDGQLPEPLIECLKKAFAERFQALAEYGPHPLKKGWFAMVATPMGLATGE